MGMFCKLINGEDKQTKIYARVRSATARLEDEEEVQRRKMKEISDQSTISDLCVQRNQVYVIANRKRDKKKNIRPYSTR